MSQAVVFASTCPHCHREQLEEGFTVEDLQRLLDGGYPIEAHCVICEEFWPISLHDRVRLGELVAACYMGRVPPEGA